MTGFRLPQVAGRLFGRPIAMEPRALQSVVEGLAPRLLASNDDDDGTVVHQTPGERRHAAHRARLASIVAAEPVPVGEIGEYGRTAEGIAVVPILGALVQRHDWLSAWCGLTSYDALSATLEAAATDPRVKAILLDIDSPGGEAAGMLDCADVVAEVAAALPVWAVANSCACSAAYALAAGANRLVLPRYGMVGSIGVLMIHVDVSAADERAGMKYTALHSGARKVDGWPHSALSDDARAGIQAQLDEARRKFAESVAAHRTSLSAAQVLATEAAVYDDAAAVKAGLADEVMSFDQALAALTAQVAGTGGGASPYSPRGAAAPTATKESTMAKDPKAAEPAEDEDKKPEDEETEGKKDGKDGKDAATQARAYAAEIADLCALAGQPERTAEFLRRAASPADVRKALLDRAADTADSRGITGAHAPASKGPKVDWSAICSKLK